MTSSPSRFSSRALPDGIVVALALALLVALLWLPFGSNVGFVQDDWINFHQLEQGTMMSQTSPTRLLTPIPWTIAYGLNPGQAAGINLFLALILFGKGWLGYRILLRLNAAQLLAFAFAVLVVVLPADTGIFYMGALAIQFSLFALLLAVWLLLVFYKSGRISALLGMMLAQLCCVGTYELAYPLIAFVPLVLLFLKPRLDGKFIRTAVLWYLIPFLYGLYYAWLLLSFPRAFAYQDSLLQQRPTILDMLSVVDDIYLRHFVTGWLRGFEVAGTATYLLVSGFAGVLVAAVCLWLGRRGFAAFSPRKTLLLALSGVVIIALGVMMYLPTELRTATERTHYYSSVGAALALAVACASLIRRPVGFALVIGIFGALGTLSLLEQHENYAEQSVRQEVVLAQLAALVPNPAPQTGIVIVDETPGGDYVRLTKGTQYAEDMLPLMYGDPSLEGALCQWVHFGTDEDSRCQFTAEGITIPSTRTWFFERPYDRLIFVRYVDGAFSVVQDLTPYRGEPAPGYQPDRLYDPSAPLPASLRELFGINAE